MTRRRCGRLDAPPVPPRNPVVPGACVGSQMPSGTRAQRRSFPLWTYYFQSLIRPDIELLSPGVAPIKSFQRETMNWSAFGSVPSCDAASAHRTHHETVCTTSLVI